jgi:hypothetical protein
MLAEDPDDIYRRVVSGPRQLSGVGTGARKFGSIRPDVCAKTSGVIRGRAMPQAERVSKNFWPSGGRAYPITGYPVSPPDGLEGCNP